LCSKRGCGNPRAQNVRGGGLGILCEQCKIKKVRYHQLATFVVEKNRIFIGCLDNLSSAHERLKQVLVYMSKFLSVDFSSTTIRRVEEGGEGGGGRGEGGGRGGLNKRDREAYEYRRDSGLCSKRGCGNPRAQNVRGGGLGVLCEQRKIRKVFL